MNRQMKSAQAGFTLVEIVVVIVLLGILAAVAVPRFVNLQSDARVAVLNGVKASIQGAGVQIYAKALIQNQTSATGTVTTNLPAPADVVNVAFGYPDAAEVVNMVNIDDPAIAFGTAAATTVTVGYDSNGDTNPANDSCYLTYTESTGVGALPTVAQTDVSAC